MFDEKSEGDLEEEHRASAAEVRRSILAGAVMTGRVISVRAFGAFVDLEPACRACDRITVLHSSCPDPVSDPE